MPTISSNVLENDTLTIHVRTDDGTAVTINASFGPVQQVTDIRIVEPSEYFVVLNFPVLNTLDFAAKVIQFLVDATDPESDHPMIIADPVPFVI